MSEHAGDAELQFETVTPPPLPGGVTVSAGISCAVCQASIPDEYFDVNGQSVCRVCRVRVLEAGETPKGWGILIVFGMLQAWRMTMAPVLNVSGPYRVGTIALASSGA